MIKLKHLDLRKKLQTFYFLFILIPDKIYGKIAVPSPFCRKPETLMSICEISKQVLSNTVFSTYLIKK